MNKTLKQITEEMYKIDLDYINIKKGNYRVVRNENSIKHYYCGELILYVDIINKELYFHHHNKLNNKIILNQVAFLYAFYISKQYNLIYKGI